MVLANRPWLLVPGLKSALVAALATGAVATINSTVWLLAGSLSWWRLVVATIASVALVVAWLVIDGELWDRPDDDSPQARERSRLYNASTLVTLMAGVLICYLALYVVNLAWAFFVLDPAVMGELPRRLARLRRPVRPGLVRRVSSNRRRWPRLRPGVGRGDSRRRLLQARGGPARPPRAQTVALTERASVVDGVSPNVCRYVDANRPMCRNPNRVATERTVADSWLASTKASRARRSRTWRRYAMGGTPKSRLKPSCRVRTLKWTACPSRTDVHGSPGCSSRSSAARATALTRRPRQNV